VRESESWEWGVLCGEGWETGNEDGQSWEEEGKCLAEEDKVRITGTISVVHLEL
jgi:hypothetical protein